MSPIIQWRHCKKRYSQSWFVQDAIKSKIPLPIALFLRNLTNARVVDSLHSHESEEFVKSRMSTKKPILCKLRVFSITNVALVVLFQGHFNCWLEIFPLKINVDLFFIIHSKGLHQWVLTHVPVCVRTKSMMWVVNALSIRNQMATRM